MSASSLGRRFTWLWAAFAVSTFGTWLAFDASALVAILVLHSGPAAVSMLAATGRAAGALAALPLGPWLEFQRKRPVMIATDLIRFAAVASVPLAYLLDWLTFAQLLVMAVTVTACDIAFKAASGAYLKTIVEPADLLTANGRLETTTWTATAVGPPLGGAAVGVLGPVASMTANAVSYLLSALGLLAIGGGEPRPVRPASRAGLGDLLEGWRTILAEPALRPLFFNTALIGGLILATSPLLAVLMLGRLHFPPWQYGLAFGAPCLGGVIGSRLARPLVERFGQHSVLVASGALRAVWSIGMAFVGPGIGGLVLIMSLQFGLLLSMGVFNPVFATWRLQRTPTERLTRTLTAWSVGTSASVAILVALWGLLATAIGLRPAIGLAGLLMLPTVLLLPRRA